MEIWIRDADTGETRPVFGEEMFSFPIGWSPDGTKLVALEFRNNSDSSLHLIDLETDESRDLTPHEDEALYFAGPWARDGSGFYMVTDAGSEFRGLAFYDISTDSYEWVEEPTQDVEDIAMSQDGRMLAWLVNEDGYDRLRLRDLETGQDRSSSRAARGCASAPDGRRAAACGLARRLARRVDPFVPAPPSGRVGGRDGDGPHADSHGQPHRRTE